MAACTLNCRAPPLLHITTPLIWGCDANLLVKWHHARWSPWWHTFALRTLSTGDRSKYLVVRSNRWWHPPGHVSRLVLRHVNSGLRLEFMHIQVPEVGLLYLREVASISRISSEICFTEPSFSLTSACLGKHFGQLVTLDFIDAHCSAAVLKTIGVSIVWMKVYAHLIFCLDSKLRTWTLAPTCIIITDRSTKNQ